MLIISILFVISLAVILYIGRENWAWAYSIVAYAVVAIYTTLIALKKGHHVTAIVVFLASVVVMVFGFSRIYANIGLADCTGSDIPNPTKIEAFYFSAVTWTTLGYGDLQPAVGARIIAAFEAFIGYVYMGVFIAIAYSVLKDSVDRGKN